VAVQCPAVWDAVRCWPATAAGRTAWQPCPDYIHNFNHSAEASRHCSPAGTWGSGAEQAEANDSLWTHSNYSQCLLMQEAVANTTMYIELWLPAVKRVAQVGYSVSLFTLVAAFIILLSIKKLRCPRNNLHLHLFASFMLRATMFLVKDVLFVQGLGLPADVKLNGDEVEEFIPGRSNWECKLIISLWQYAIMANYSWILMEGLYLHNLIFLALFSDNSAITFYVCLGWGLPASVVLPWVIGRRYLDDRYCWNLNDHYAVYAVVRIPTIVTVFVSFALFVNIARVLLVKMQASVQVQQRSMRYRRWARSTMVLMPLFGTHYALSLLFQAGVGHHEVLEIAWLLFDQTFSSFQGCLVALLYCLLTREVRVEVRRRWQSTRTLWSGRRSGSFRRPGSLLQSAPSLSRPPPPGCGYHRPSDLPGQNTRRSLTTNSKLDTVQISGRQELDRLDGVLDDNNDNMILDDSKNKDVEVQSMQGLTALSCGRGQVGGDAQSWV
ncbi:Parathyroid hormone/parathyroid hormone-related peptide receptor, partial [Frankliniella fusca]